MFFSSKNLLLILSIFLLINELTEAAPSECVSPNGEECSKTRSFFHHAAEFASKHLFSLLGMLAGFVTG
ncbi:unnamed protein product [Allacma fusca]|uniref:Uncharacterized protein n=1 Tax=Allacma fusca TaxID=39272 RepID=A0A8J2PRA4_9HEXA|nr:unnamed protein product [Allacma fusca]